MFILKCRTLVAHIRLRPDSTLPESPVSLSVSEQAVSGTSSEG